MLTRTFIGALALACSAFSFAKTYFSDDERQTVVTFWSEPGRYTVEPLGGPRGKWQVRQTVDGSKWLWNYNKARGLGKTNPGQVPGAQNEAQVAWETWIEAKIAYDKWAAAKKAFDQNTVENDASAKDPGPAPAAPGAMPEGLKSLAGEAPSFAEAVAPQKYAVQFEDGKFEFSDQVPLQFRFAYFRFPQGVMSSGTPVKKLTQEDLSSLFMEAGINESEGRVLKSVSLLEGGFDSINTYDTGFLSVGFIQFASGQNGTGSLGSMLLRHKTEAPTDFQSDFRRFGVDVNDKGALVVLDLNNGDELEGNAAVLKVIEDKRLTAVFQRAGRNSRSFRIAQLKAAKAGYYPAADTFTIKLEDQSITLRVSDVVRTEAGLATLMDRKVNTGRIDPLPSVVKQMIEATGARTADELALYEKEILEQLRYRKNYLDDVTLSQPVEAPSRLAGSKTNRSGSTRTGRGKRGG